MSNDTILSEPFQFMRDFRQRNKIRDFVFSKGIFLILLVILVYILSGVWNIWQYDKSARGALAVKMEELNLLKEKQTALLAKIGSLQTSKGIEEEIRKKFSVAKEGEQVFVVVSEASSTEESGKNKDGVFKRFFDILR